MDYLRNAVGFAEDILSMQYEIETLRQEVKRLKDIERKYNDLLNASLKYGQEMSGQVMELITNKGEFRSERSCRMGNNDQRWKEAPGYCVECGLLNPLNSSAVCEDCYNESDLHGYGLWSEDTHKSRAYYENLENTRNSEDLY